MWYMRHLPALDITTLIFKLICDKEFWKLKLGRANKALLYAFCAKKVWEHCHI
jgi:hypothetical protein